MTTYQSPPTQHQYMSIGEQYTSSKHQIHGKTHPQSQPSSPFHKIQQGITALIFIIINFFATLPFRIMKKILYFIEKAARYILWINIKGLVSWVNFVYRLFAFFRIAKVVALLQMIAKTYFPEYTSVDFDRAERNLSRFSLLMSKKNIDLINVDKFQRKVKKPTLFEKYSNKKEKRTIQGIRNENVERQTQTMVRQKSQQENGNQDVSPRLLRLSHSHEKLKKNEGNQGSFGSGIRVEIPARERDIADRRIFPDRDISPQRYMKPIPRIGEYGLSDKQQDYQDEKSNQLNEKKIRNEIPAYPTQRQSELAKQSREQLEKELAHLRQKMQQLIQDNTHYIKDLQEWLKQKSQTIMMTRTENIELLQEMQELQKENISKTSKLQHLQEKVKEIELALEKQKSETGELCKQIVKLNAEIQTKSIQIIVLKDRINTNLRKFHQHQGESKQTNIQQKPQKGQKISSQETLQDKITFQKLKQQEMRTEQLADEVQKVLKQEMERLKTEPLEDKMEEIVKQEKEKRGTIEDDANLILDDPRQAYGVEQSEQKQSFQEGKKSRKSSQGRIIRSDGNKTITMRTE